MKTILSLIYLFIATGAFAQNAAPIQQGSTTRKILFLLVGTSDHTTPVVGATPSVSLSKNGSPFAAPAGTVAEVGSGWYALTPNAADTALTGPLILHATATGADPSNTVSNVVAYNPDDNNALGLAAFNGLPASILAAIKADPKFTILLNHNLGKFTFVPATKTETELEDDGVTTIGSVVMTIDGNSNVLSRE